MSGYLDSADFIRDFLNKQDEAFDVLFDAYYSRLHVYSAKITGNSMQSEEIVTDSFYQIWLYKGKFDETCKLGNILRHLYTIVRNASLDYKKSVSARVGKNTSAVDPNLISPDPGVLLSMIKQEVNYQLYQAFKRLPEERQQAILLIHVHGYTYEAAAEKMQVPLGTLKSYRSAGFTQMRKLLANDRLVPTLAVWLVIFFF